MRWTCPPTSLLPHHQGGLLSLCSSHETLQWFVCLSAYLFLSLDWGQRVGSQLDFPAQCLAHARAQRYLLDEQNALGKYARIFFFLFQETIPRESGIQQNANVQALNIMRPRCPIFWLWISEHGSIGRYNTMRAVSLVLMVSSQVVSGSMGPSSTTLANAQAFPPWLTHLAKAWAGPWDCPLWTLKLVIVLFCEWALCSHLVWPHDLCFACCPCGRRQLRWEEAGESWGPCNPTGGICAAEGPMPVSGW